jgi:hypothetical protein
VKEGFLEAEGTGRGKRYFLPGRRPVAGDEPFRDYSFPDIVAGDAETQKDSEHLGARSEHLDSLRWLAAEMRTKKKVSKAVMTRTILAICDDFRSLTELSGMLNRKSDSLGVHYINKLVAEGKLELKYPNKRNHHSQRYKTKPYSISG